MKLAPIVVFVYNRPHYLKETLQSLSENAEAAESTLYIYCDGPKEDASVLDLKKIKEARDVAKEKQWCKNVIIIESEINQGLSKNIISGVNEIFSKHDRIIVLEDDLVTSKYFLHYVNTALNLYEDVTDVISVVGYNYPIQFEAGFPDTYFIKNADCLGWATWKRGWDLFEEDANVLVKKIEESHSIQSFNFDNQYPFMKMLKLVALKKVNSWAIRWYASSFVNDKLTLFPKKSLVRHIGNIGSNTKADSTDVFGWEVSNEPVLFFETNLVEKQENRKKWSQHFRKYNRRRLSISSISYAFKRFVLPIFRKS